MNCDRLFKLFTRTLSKSALARNHNRPSSSNSTIFALASGHGKCAISVFRISGPEARQAILKMGKFNKLPTSRLMMLRKIYDPHNNDLIDKGIVTWHPGPNSFTGEDYCEFHVHGGLSVLQSMASALSKLPFFRLAEPGEFTKRAFVNNKMDLTEVEGLADVINAETEGQRKQALRQMMGELGKLYSTWSRKILQSLAHTEAYIDFSEDQNIEDNVMDSVVENIINLRNEIAVHLNDRRRGERLRSGVNIVIVGEPNVGKSSLLNKICQRPAAIVSPIPGTTRDIVEVLYDIDGYPVRISDTAGLRTTEDMIEKEGIARAKKRAETADLIIWLMDAVKLHSVLKEQTFQWNVVRKFSEDVGLRIVETGSSKGESTSDELLRIDKKNILIVINKIDLMNQNCHSCSVNQSNVFPISCLTEENLTNFLNGLSQKVQELCANPAGENIFLTSSRHRIHLEATVENLESFLRMQTIDIVIAAEFLRRALHHIGKITGQVSSSQILDVIFKDFCIGK